MPYNFLFVWLFQLLSVGVLGGGIYILYEWYERELVGTSYLVAGLVMFLWSFGGRFISLPHKLQKPLLEPVLYLTIVLWPIFWLMTWLSYLNGSLYITVELSGFTGTETTRSTQFCRSIISIGFAWCSGSWHTGNVQL
ncbi:hypothetical protein [uncultured Nostoc sp.]|uniref:hypothetical protein n=1 Tax=uncultured Nostoc sp. TaxID=340711 RepID=UPI0035C94E44